MHIPDGLLKPEIWAPLAAASATAAGLSARKAQKSLEDESIPLVGLVGAFVFALQMLNFPVAAGVSDHIVGAGLLAIVFGPSIAMVAMAAILVLQALLFGDGGITALGANVFNMGVLSVLSAWLVYGALRRINDSFAVAAAVVGGVLAGSTGAAVEVMLSSAYGAKFFAAMTAMHLVSGVVEALVTVAVARVLRSADLIGKRRMEAADA